jgi:hypothetical protein
VFTLTAEINMRFNDPVILQDFLTESGELLEELDDSGVRLIVDDGRMIAAAVGRQGALSA